MFSDRDLKHLILPLFVEQFLLMFVGIADTFVVSFASEADVSGVSLVASFNTVFIFLFTALSSGGAVIISQYIGSRNERAAAVLGVVRPVARLGRYWRGARHEHRPRHPRCDLPLAAEVAEVDAVSGDLKRIFAHPASGRAFFAFAGKTAFAGTRRNRALLARKRDLCYSGSKEAFSMDTKDILRSLRIQKGLSQDELAEQVFVTRQAVSRWENGETTPNTETLKQLSRLFDVSINTLLGAPRQLICQCCGMPLDDGTTSKEPDGAFNEEYCKWCYADGKFTYTSPEQLIDFCVQHMATEAWPAEQVRAHMEAVVPQLDHWRK